MNLRARNRQRLILQSLHVPVVISDGHPTVRCHQRRAPAESPQTLIRPLTRASSWRRVQVAFPSLRPAPWRPNTGRACGTGPCRPRRSRRPAPTPSFFLPWAQRETESFRRTMCCCPIYSEHFGQARSPALLRHPRALPEFQTRKRFRNRRARCQPAPEPACPHTRRGLRCALS
jgi:hypothetical protein